MDYSNHYKINNSDCWTSWGVVFRRGTIAELIKRAKRKEVFSHSWADENGTERYIPSTALYESRQLSLPVAIFATGEEEFQTRLNGFLAAMVPGYFNFDAVDINRRFKLIYDETISPEFATAVTDTGKVVAQFTINLIDDYPNEINTIPE